MPRVPEILCHVLRPELIFKEAKMRLKKIFSRCHKEGIHARNETPEKQSIIQIYVKEWLEAIQEKWINTWNMIGSFYTTKRKELLEKLQTISRGVPYEIHREHFKYGIIYFMILLFITFAEFWIVLWTLRPFGLGLEIYLISFVIMSTGMLSIHFFLNKLKENNPGLYRKVKLYLTVISLIAVLIAGAGLAMVRGQLMATERAVQEDSENIEKVDSFYDRTSIAVVVSMGLIAVCLSLIGGVVLHEALPKLIVSGNVIRTYRKAEEYERRIVNAGNQVETGRQIIKIGMIEFKRGLYSDSNRRNWLTPLCVLFVFLSPLLKANLEAGEKHEIYVMFDRSKSTLCRTSKENQFQKNLEAVPSVIKQAPPGSEVKIAGITDSFGNTSVLLECSFPEDPGAFREKLGRARQKMIENLNGLKLSPEYDETDIFGALFYAAINFQGRSGTKTLIVFSDMRNSVGINIEDLPVIGDEVIRKVEKEGLIPDLTGVRVYCLGISPCGKSLKYWQSLERFWRRYFEKAGAELVCFSIERKFSMD